MPKAAETLLSDIDILPSVQLGNYTLNFDLGEASPEIQEVARNELRENPDIKREAIIALRNLLKDEPDLLVPADNDTFLVRFLRPCKYYPQSAFELMKRYYQFKVKHVELYTNLKPSRETNIFEQDILTCLPNRDQFGRRILILELGKRWKHNKCSLDEVYKGAVLYLEAALLEPTTQIAGGIVIFDMDGLSLPQTMQFTPQFAKRIVDLLQESIPVRVKNFHVVNQPYIFNMVFALFKPFLKDKLKSRIIFHGTDRKSLHKYISPSCLPASYGGTLDLPRITGPQWLELLLKCDKEYDAINSYGYKKKTQK